MAAKQVGEQERSLRGSDGADGSLRDLLAGYDREVEASLRSALEAETGLERVQTLHLASRVVTVHDAVLLSALCPLLDDLPGGQAVADRLRHGCAERAALLLRFEGLTRNVTAPNVYPVSGEEVEEILEELSRSLDAHVTDETRQVGDLLTATAGSVDPDVVAVRMALEAGRSPTRAHRAAVRHPRSTHLKRYYRLQDRWADWRDTHNGWLESAQRSTTPRAHQAAGLLDPVGSAPPTVRDVLSGYDKSVADVIAEWRVAGTADEQISAVQRLSAAITIHDAVLGGVLCPLLDALPAAKEPVAKLRAGCLERADLQRQLTGLVGRIAAGDSYDTHRAVMTPVVEALIESFDAHEHVETGEVTPILEELPSGAYRTKGSLLADAMWPWHSEGPELLALQMAMWAKSSPSRPHPLLEKHPTSSTLRSWFHTLDHWRHFTAETPLEKWLVPKLPAAPFSTGSSATGSSATGTARPVPGTGTEQPDTASDRDARGTPSPSPGVTGDEGG